MHGDQSHMRDYYFHDSQVNSVKAPTRPFDLCWFIFRVRDHYFHDSQVNSVNPRYPHDSPLQLCTYCTLSAILHGKNIQFWFWFFMFSIDISLWSPNNNILLALKLMWLPWNYLLSKIWYHHFNFFLPCLWLRTTGNFTRKTNILYLRLPKDVSRIYRMLDIFVN